LKKPGSTINVDIAIDGAGKLLGAQDLEVAVRALMGAEETSFVWAKTEFEFRLKRGVQVCLRWLRQEFWERDGIHCSEIRSGAT
jgi:hypothetical protein